jgi:cation diffusion facilitator CzcD-associated flavoprotein CzcO
VSAPHTVIVGAGPAGLAVATCLERAGVPCLVLERSTAVASAWHRHYDRLQLHTDKSHSELPFAPFPQNYPRYPSRTDLIAYLEDYAGRLRSEIRLGQEVRSVGRADGVWEIRTATRTYQAPTAVIATGYNREPYVPAWPDRDRFRGTMLHSSRYQSGEQFVNQEVLVVGFGNSGGEIAMDLAEHGARVSMAVRGPVNVVPRELFGIPILSIGVLQSKLPPRVADAISRPILRATIGDLGPLGLRRSEHGTMTRIRRDARIPLIDVGTIDLIRRGRITIRPGIERFTWDGVVFTDGCRRRFDVVVLATGYRPRVDTFLRNASAVLDPDGAPLMSGRETPIPGLYFCGYRVSPTGMLREIGREAGRIASAIARARARPRPSVALLAR